MAISLFLVVSLSVLSCLCALSFSSAFASAESYDVCVVGGGASGSASAVFLKQRGYSVKVIEQNNTLGGHCNTVNFNAPNGEQLWLDIGVEVFENTSWGRANGFGDWALDTSAFISQFVPASLIIPVGGSAPGGLSFNADFLTGQFVNSSFNATDFQIAFGTLLGIGMQYPWINTGERPDPVPSWMLLPFSEFIVANNLQVLVDPLFNGVLFSGGVGSLWEMSTLEAFAYLPPAVLLIFGAGNPGAGISIEGGCHVLYEGIAAYLGDAVTYNAKIRSVKRYQNGPASIKGSFVNAAGHKDSFNYQCGKTIMSIYPLLENLVPWFDLTEVEAALFSNVEAHGYLAMATTFTEGELVAGQGFGLVNLDPTQPYNLPTLPNLSSFQRSLPFGPAAAWVNAQSSCTPAGDLLDVAWDEFSGVPSSVASNIQISAWSFHQYGPHWTTDSQGQSPSPDTRLTNLQGNLGTFWVGAAVVNEGSALVWNHAYKLILQHFPQKA